MEKPSIYIPIEVKARELTSQVFLSKFAINKGFRVYVGSKPAINRLLERKKKVGGVLIFKGGLHIKNIIKIKKKINSFTILDQELSPSCTDFYYEMKRRYWPNSEKLIDRYYVIGQHAYEVGNQVFNEMSKNIVKSGWPSIDMIRNENQKIFEKQANIIKNKYGDFILISSAFGFNSQKIIDDFYQQNKNEIWESLRATLKKELEIAQLTLEEFKINIEVLKEIDQNSHCPQIIIRPHPSEDHLEWKKISNSFKRIKVIFEGEITPWIYAANALLHRGCAAAITAYMAGKPIGYPILKKEIVKKALPYELSQHLYNSKDIIEFCKQNIHKNSIPLKKYNKEFQRYIHIEKKYASELILEDILKLKLDNEQAYKPSLEDNIFSISLNLSKFFKSKLKLFLKSKKSISIAPQEQKMPGGITESEIKDILLSLSENKNFKVKKLFQDCVMIDSI